MSNCLPWRFGFTVASLKLHSGFAAGRPGVMVSKLGPLGTGIYWLEPSYGVKASIIPPDHSFAARQKRTSWLPAPLLSFGAMGWRMLMLLAAAPAAAFMPAAAPATSAAPRPLHAPRKLSRASIEDGRSSVPMLRGGGDDAKAARAYRAVAGFLDRRYFLVGAASAVAMAAIAPTIGCTGGVPRPELTSPFQPAQCPPTHPSDYIDPSRLCG